MRLIEEANVFQLFWSHNAMRSQFVRQEWEYALSLRRPEFIRPTYWETPFPEAPETGLPPEHLRRIHFHFIGTQAHKDVRSDAEIAILSPRTEPPTAHSPRATIGAPDLAPAPCVPTPTSIPRRRRRPRAGIWLGTATAFAMLAAVGLWSFTGSSGPKTASAPSTHGPPDPQPKFELVPDTSNNPPPPPSGPLARPDDLQAQRNWSKRLETLAGLSLRAGNLEEARTYLQHDLEIWEGPVFKATQEAKSQLSQALQQADTLLRQGKTEEARRSFLKYLEIADRLAKSLSAEPNGKADSPAPSGR